MQRALEGDDVCSVFAGDGQARVGRTASGFVEGVEDAGEGELYGGAVRAEEGGREVHGRRLAGRVAPPECGRQASTGAENRTWFRGLSPAAEPEPQQTLWLRATSSRCHDSNRCNDPTRDAPCGT